ncbi:zinc finger protein 181-like isoform X3 [Spodoptera litura]|uniref:Zinc finger protein 181-like isoform X3 n=1 Tax=Spodoptera litura TaxID=69820 RepID=A0A9J7DZT0_SPOLT|nr:zinc finger protein 181-like isoform X3 [Spodoptera litura]
MSEDKTEVETFFGRCRCCLTYGYLKNMWLEHKYNGNPEIYGEMLAKCFALTWDHSEDSIEQDQICEACIVRLRDAYDFKKVVLDSQEELTRMLEDENHATIKEERLDEQLLAEQGGDDGDDNLSNTETEYITFNNDTMESIKEEAPEMEYTDIEYLEDEVANITKAEDNSMVEDYTKDSADSDSSQSYKPEPAKRKKRPRVSEPEDDDDESGKPKRKWPPKLPKSERHKTYKQYSETDLRKCLDEIRSGALTPADASVQYNIPKKTICAKIKMNSTDVQWNDTAKEETKQKSKVIVQKFKENARTIIQCTNATPIKGHWGIGYSCLHCPYQSPDPTELKKHTLTTHFSNSDPIETVKYVSDMVLRIDITDLKCEICDLPMENLKDVMMHLKTNHNQPMHLDIPNHIIPFKFNDEFLQCALCSKQFDFFKHLSEHMTEHYSNYECTDCGKHFINKRALRTHIVRHQKGVFVCAFCPKIFDTRIKMKEHERVLHMKGSKTRKCGYCDEKFMDTVRKNDHEVKVHGAPIPQFCCKACGKNFDSQRSLKSHINHFHLLLRPHKCPECGKGFYNKNEMKRHIVKHTKLKEYQCQICSKYYVTRTSLRSHMKIHSGQSTYTCERCGDTFIQKKTWIQHVTKHAEEAKSEMEAIDNCSQDSIFA